MTLQEFGVSYGYFLFNFLFVFVWFLFYFIRKDLRRELIWSSIILTPAALLEVYFIGPYWHPGILFNLVERFGFSIESFFYSFFMGGIAGISYEIVFRKKLRRIKTKHHLRLIPFFTLISFTAILMRLGLNTHLLSLIIPAILVALMIVFIRHDLANEMLWGGIILAFIYWLLGEVFFLTFPTYVENVWVMDKLWGIYLVHAPLEEILFGFSVGAVWAPFYEYVRGYGLTSYKTHSARV